MVKQRKDMARMEDWWKEMEEFKGVVPDAMNFERWLVERQKTWSDGILQAMLITSCLMHI